MKKFFVLSLVFLIFITSDLEAEDSHRKLRRELSQALKSGKIDLIKEATGKLTRRGKRKDLSLLLKLAPKVYRHHRKVYWILIYGAGSFESQESLERLAHFLIRNKKHGISRDLMHALAHNKSPHMPELLGEVLQRGPYDLKHMAIDQLATFLHPKSVKILLTFWKKWEKSSKKDKLTTLVKRIVQALRALSGQNMGESCTDWQKWWDLSGPQDMRARIEKVREKGKKKDKKTKKGKKKQKGPQRGTVLRRKTGTVLDHSNRYRTLEYNRLRSLEKKHIVVVEGCFDKIQKVLENMKIPHTLVTRKEFCDRKFSLEGVMALLINCHRYSGKDALSKRTLRKIRLFVQQGGYLFTEDWGLVDVLEKIWPKRARRTASTGKKTVSVHPSYSWGGHPLLRNVFSRPIDEGKKDSKKRPSTVSKGLKRVDHSWRVDGASFVIGIGKNAGVVKLLISDEFKKMTGGNDCIAITFRVGSQGKKVVTGRYRRELSLQKGGCVLHIISHFGRQPTKNDKFALETLLLNFLSEANEIRELKKK